MARGRQLGAAVGRMTPTSRSEVHNESVYRGRPTLAPLCSNTRPVAARQEGMSIVWCRYNRSDDRQELSMLIHELSTDDCASVLRRNDLGRLGCAHFDQPYIVPIHFSFDEDRNCLYAFSAMGQKIDWMRDNPKVCLEVEEIADKNNWTTILVIGSTRKSISRLTRPTRAVVRSSCSSSAGSGGCRRRGRSRRATTRALWSTGSRSTV